MAKCEPWQHWEIVFDKDGDADAAAREELLDKIANCEGLTDVIFFSHGWNNDQKRARNLYTRWLAMLPPLLPAASAKCVATVGILWPSMMWVDEPIPNFPDDGGTAAFADDANPVLALVDAKYDGQHGVFDQQQQDILGRLAMLLDAPPATEHELDEKLAQYKTLVDQLAATEKGDGTPEDDGAKALLSLEPRELADRFRVDNDNDTTEAAGVDDGGIASLSGAAGAGADASNLDGGEAGLRELVHGVWSGAKEALRQVTYWQMKRRAGLVGEKGLGPLLQDVKHQKDGVRVHLLGHSFGARLVSFSLKGIASPDASPVCSVTLMQGAFSHNSFGSGLKWGNGTGALHGHEAKVHGPIVACFSKFDSAVGTMYVLASKAQGENLAGVVENMQPQWGGIGHDGAQGVTAHPMDLVAGTTAYTVPQTGFVNVDSETIVQEGHFPSGAHSDIFHEELAGIVMAASGLTS